MELALKILNRLNISKPQKKFLITLFTTILVVRGKTNFRNLSRYSDLCEHTYSRNFSKSFDFASFNRQVIDETFAKEDEHILAFDQSFIPKAGSHTFGRDRFWNGSLSRNEKGLEISSLAVVNVSTNQALTLSVQQTRSQDDTHVGQSVDDTRVDQYLLHLEKVCSDLVKDERYLVVDGYFAKEKFINGVTPLNLHIIGKLRCDANMRYLYSGPKHVGRGRPKVYDGKVSWDDLSRFKYVGVDKNLAIYTALLNHTKFKCDMRVVVLVKHRLNKPAQYTILFSTDTHLDPFKIYHFYKARFQIEFLFRDAKQFTGLCHCQATDQPKLHFHFNASLTALNLARAELINTQNSAQPLVCSMASVKALYFNKHFLQRIFSILDFDPNCIKNQYQYFKLLHYGKIAA
jgi:hypothetical protein